MHIDSLSSLYTLLVTLGCTEGRDARGGEERPFTKAKVNQRLFHRVGTRSSRPSSNHLQPAHPPHQKRQDGAAEHRRGSRMNKFTVESTVVPKVSLLEPETLSNQLCSRSLLVDTHAHCTPHTQNTYTSRRTPHNIDHFHLISNIKTHKLKSNKPYP